MVRLREMKRMNEDDIHTRTWSSSESPTAQREEIESVPLSDDEDKCISSLLLSDVQMRKDYRTIVNELSLLVSSQFVHVNSI